MERVKSEWRVSGINVLMVVRGQKQGTARSNPSCVPLNTQRVSQQYRQVFCKQERGMFLPKALPISLITVSSSEGSWSMYYHC